MKERLMSVMREFYHDGIPDGVVPRDVEYAEKLRVHYSPNLRHGKR